MPWSWLVSVLTSWVPFCVKTCTKCHLHCVSSPPLASAALSPPPPVPYLYPSCPPQSAPKCKLGQGSLPQAPNLLWLEKNSVAPSHRGKQRSRMLLLPCCCSSSDLCNSFSVLTHSSGTIYTLLPFLCGLVRRFTPIMFAPSLGKSRTW